MAAAEIGIANVEVSSSKRPRLTSPEAAENKQLTQEHIFRNLRLRRIVRENHNTTISQLALMFLHPEDINSGNNGRGIGGMVAYERSFDKRGNAIRNPEDNSNLLGTVGHTQTNIYDNENCGDHLDIMSHFQLGSDECGILKTCCWIKAPGDTLLAVAGEDKQIHILSLAWTREIRVLCGHTTTVVDLQPHPTDGSMLASVSSDNTVRIWNIHSGLCLCILDCPGATVGKFHPDGKSLFIGSATGGVWQWQIPEFETADTIRMNLADNGSSTLVVPDKKQHITAVAVDCLQFAKSCLLVKTISGRIEYWDLQTCSLIRTFVIRHHGVNESRFDVSFDDNYICAGNSRGEVYVFEIGTGKAIRHLVHKRSVRPVTCCLFTRDGRGIIYAGEGGFIWRYDYVDDETLAEWEKPNEGEQEDGSSSN